MYVHLQTLIFIVMILYSYVLVIHNYIPLRTWSYLLFIIMPDCIEIHPHTARCLFCFIKAAGSSGECWGKSGASLVTISTQATQNFILAGMVETDDCGTKAPYVTHTKLDGFQQWITENLHP